ncbi:MAG: cupredoxin domain-containing protein [Dehalococcoidia bacterium]
MQRIMDRPFYTRIALLGVALVLSLAAFLFVVILIFSPDDVVFPIIMGVVALIVGALILFIPYPWGLVFAVLAGAVCFLFVSDKPELSFGSPDSFFDFIFPVMFVPAGLFLLVGGITGLVQHFRHQPTNGNSTLVAGVKGVFAVVVALLAISAVLTVLNLGSASAADKEGAAYLKTKDDEFTNQAISASPSGKIVIDNRDPYLHTFTIDDLDLDVKIGGGSYAVINLDNVKPGEYFFHCRVSGHESMDGKLTVQ